MKIFIAHTTTSGNIFSTARDKTLSIAEKVGMSVYIVGSAFLAYTTTTVAGKAGVIPGVFVAATSGAAIETGKVYLRSWMKRN